MAQSRRLGELTVRAVTGETLRRELPLVNKYERQLKAIELEIREGLEKARKITSEAMDEGRSLEDDERKELDGYLKAVDVLKEKKEEVEDAIATRARVDEVGKSIKVEEPAPDPNAGHTRAQSIGEAFTKSDGYRRCKSGQFRGDWTTGPIEIEGKALLSTLGTGADTAGGALITADIQPGILDKRFQRLTVADLMASGSTTSNSVTYMRETLATNAAAGVVEGVAKPESSLEFDAVTEPVKKLATWLPVTEEMLDDVSALQSYINSRLALFVRIEEEDQLLNGTGGTADLTGLLARIPAANKGMRKGGSVVNDADHIFRAMSRVREAFLEPDGIVIHPNDWEGIVLMKTGITNDNSYLGNGPFNPELGRTLWGMRVVVTSAVAEAQPIVGAFGTEAQVFRKGGLSVEASNSHASYFVENKVAIRAEERLAFAVYRPEAFATADLGTAGVAT